MMNFKIYTLKELVALKKTYNVEIEQIARELGTSRKQIHRVFNDQNVSLAYKIAVTEYFRKLIEVKNGSVTNPIADLPLEAKQKLGVA